MDKVCRTCKHYWKTALSAYSLEPYMGKGYTFDEAIELCKFDKPEPVYTCHLADNWTDPDDECMIDKWEPKDGLEE